MMVPPVACQPYHTKRNPTKPNRQTLGSPEVNVCSVGDAASALTACIQEDQEERFKDVAC